MSALYSASVSNSLTSLANSSSSSGKFLREDGKHGRAPPVQALEVVLRRVVGRGNAAHPTRHGLARFPALPPNVFDPRGAKAHAAALPAI